ncbi:fibronectin type III domain-containing protein [Curtobacterium sp. MCBA15_001]|uniref:fibronectin type III domain-containing protein n=1 Tax=Curtobacterium sp. MCBA15_001 TaxID=1898731 RepID=UPI0008DC9930|nr:fibronectin type III domain-containing protein [Curtobacterium sp. MCBA15_001]OIH96337.1 hypothetical protein BIU90_17525 [Curtobacterium sp. MCBA15_001]
MYRAVLTVAAAAVLVAVGVTPAQAAPTVPGAPSSVAVSGTGGDADVTWGLPRSGGAVTGWQVTISPADQQPNRGVDRLPAAARRDHFGSLRDGVTYTFAVRAVGARGTGPAVQVRHRASTPAPAAESLFALDAAGNVVRYPTTGTGTARTIAPNGAGYTADDRGDVFVPSADRTSVLMYPAGGAAPRTVVSGQHLTADLRSDVAGNLYWVDSVSGSVVRLPVTGGAPEPWVSFPQSSLSGARGLWAVGRDGTVSTWSGNQATVTVTSRTPAGATSTRAVSFGTVGTFGYVQALLADGHGGLYVNWLSPGAAGAFIWYALPAGATTWVSAEPRLAFEYAATNTDSFRLLQSAEWCTTPSENTGKCAVDRSIPALTTRAVDGTTTSVPVTGLTAGSRGANIAAADGAGDVFVDIDAAPTAGLWRVPAAGGAAQQLSAAQFSRLLVI